MKAIENILGHIVVMSEKNPGALRVLTELAHKIPDGVLAVQNLDEMGIRGWRVFFVFKDYCKENLDKLLECALNKDKRMIGLINEEETTA